VKILGLGSEKEQNFSPKMHHNFFTIFRYFAGQKAVEPKIDFKTNYHPIRL